MKLRHRETHSRHWSKFFFLIALFTITFSAYAGQLQGPLGDYGDAPDQFMYDLDADPTYFPTGFYDSDKIDFLIHRHPEASAILGAKVSRESNALFVDQDDDDGWLSTSFPVCEPAQMDLHISMPADALEGAIYLNVLFDWNRDHEWQGTDQQCPVGTKLPSTRPGMPWATPIPVGPYAVEWGIENLRLDVAPFNVVPGFNGLVTVPAVLSGATPGEFWMRITLSTEPISDLDHLPAAFGGAGWNGASDFLYGETEDYRSCLVERGKIPSGCPQFLSIAPPADPEPEQVANPIVFPFIPPPAATGATNDSSGSNQSNGSQSDSADSNQNAANDNAGNETESQQNTGDDAGQNEAANDAAEGATGEGETASDPDAEDDSSAANDSEGETASEASDGQDTEPNNGDQGEDGEDTSGSDNDAAGNDGAQTGEGESESGSNENSDASNGSTGQEGSESSDADSTDSSSESGTDNSETTGQDGENSEPADSGKQACNAGRGNGAEAGEDGEDCDPGNSAENNNAGDGEAQSGEADDKDDKQTCNAGRGNGAEEDEDGKDCDPGNSEENNNGGD